MKHALGMLVLMAIFTGCLSVAPAAKSALGTQTLEVVNLMAYSDYQIDKEIGKTIWNKQVTIMALPKDGEILGRYAEAQPDAYEILNDTAITDLHYSLELATVLCYLGYIKMNAAEENVETRALEHARMTYQSIKINVVAKNPKTIFNDPRGFAIFLKSKEPEVAVEGVYSFTR